MLWKDPGDQVRDAQALTRSSSCHLASHGKGAFRDAFFPFSFAEPWELWRKRYGWHFTLVSRHASVQHACKAPCFASAASGGAECGTAPRWKLSGCILLNATSHAGARNISVSFLNSTSTTSNGGGCTTTAASCSWRFGSEVQVCASVVSDHGSRFRALGCKHESFTLALFISKASEPGHSGFGAFVHARPQYKWHQMASVISSFSAWAELHTGLLRF